MSGAIRSRPRSGTGSPSNSLSTGAPLEREVDLGRHAACADRGSALANVGGSSTGSTRSVKVRFGSMAETTAWPASSSPLSSTTPVATAAAAENLATTRARCGSWRRAFRRPARAQRSARPGRRSRSRRCRGDADRRRAAAAACRRCRPTSVRPDCRRSPAPRAPRAAARCSNHSAARSATGIGTQRDHAREIAPAQRARAPAQTGAAATSRAATSRRSTAAALPADACDDRLAIR